MLGFIVFNLTVTKQIVKGNSTYYAKTEINILTEFKVPQDEFLDKLATSLIKGELGDKIAAQLAGFYAEITTYNRTDAAKLLNIARSTLYQYEEAKLIAFGSDGRISLASLREFRRKISQPKDEPENREKIVNRHPHKSKKRRLK